MKTLSAINFVGIGDLHLDGKLSKFIPNLNEVILDEVRKPLDHARRNGIRLAILYGDICDLPHMSYDATTKLVDLFFEYQDIRFIVLLGNHDIESTEKNSLQVIQHFCSKGLIPNLKIIDKPTVMFRSRGTPIRFLPWPHFSVREDCLNVIHIETNGSRWEVGGAIESERDTEYNCVGGHLHTMQISGKKKNIHYSGTLYQTSFGEKSSKYFHVGSWDGKTLDLEVVPTTPRYTLINKIVASQEDLLSIESDPYKLYKVFVKSGVEMSAETFLTMPNVVKINTFQNRKELENLIAEELILGDASAEINSLSVLDALNNYMVNASVKKSVADRAREIATSFFNS